MERLDLVEEQSRKSCDFGKMRVAIALGVLGKAYTVSSRTTVALIWLEIDGLYAGFFAPGKFHDYRWSLNKVSACMRLDIFSPSFFG